MPINQSVKIKSIIAAALVGGSYWPTVRAAGEGCGPSMGLIWGLYWLLLMYWMYPGVKIPTKANYILLVFIVGFGVGGMQGYGQFNQWMRGLFYFDRSINAFTPISPVYGFYHLFIAGLTWGGFPALLLSWILTHQVSLKQWLVRILVALAGYLFFQWLLSTFPQYFLPLFSHGYYQDLNFCVDCQRTIDTAVSTYGRLGIFLSLALLTALTKRAGLYIILPIALGFALSFSVGGLLHRGYLLTNQENPWWKMWEFSCGFGGGLSLFVTFWIIEKQGILADYINKLPNIPKQWPIWMGFWIPLYFAIGELAQNRINQVAKVWNILYQYDVRDEFSILAYITIAVTIIIFLWHISIYMKNEAGSKGVEILNPGRFFRFVFSGFFILILWHWIRLPLTFENNVISIITGLAFMGAHLLLYKLDKNFS